MRRGVYCHKSMIIRLLLNLFEFGTLRVTEEDNSQTRKCVILYPQWGRDS